MPTVTANHSGVQQEFVDRIRSESRSLQFPIIAGGDDAAAAAGGDASTQASSQGNGAGSVKGQGGFNWGNFPDVPEEQRALLEPHLKNVQGHITKLEERFAPFKDLPEGVKAETIQGLIQLDQAFAQDPVGTWVRMGQQMQSNGQLSNELDFDAVQAILSGEEPPEINGAGTVGPDGEQGVDPALQQALDKVAQLEERLNTQDQQTQQQKQDALLQENLNNMKTQLIEAGIAEDDITEELLVGQVIASRGDIDAATQAILGFRDSQLKGFTEKAKSKQSKDDLDLPNGLPKSKARSRSNDEWGKAKAGAAHMLETKIQASN